MRDYFAACKSEYHEYRCPKHWHICCIECEFRFLCIYKCEEFRYNPIIETCQYLLKE